MTVSTSDRRAIIVVDLAYGDCGKGTIVDYLARQHAAHTVVRFNGGPQSGHNVIGPDGRHHTFAQIGSGGLIPGVRTLLSRFMLIEPYALLNEAAHLIELGPGDPLALVDIDRSCRVITPSHQAANRLRELARGDGAHGTCGQGIGEAVKDDLAHPELTFRAGELADRQRARRKLEVINAFKLDQLREIVRELVNHPMAQASLRTLEHPEWIDTAIDVYAQAAARARIIDERAVHAILSAPGTILFEGAQGVLLDEHFGFHPHTTWSDTTFNNAQSLLDKCNYQGMRTRLGVLRAYFTRHGPGPFVTHDPGLHLPEPHNRDDSPQGPFRMGPFDAVAARYAMTCAPVDGIALTHLDRLPQLPRRICTAYQTAGGEILNDIPKVHPMDFRAREKLTQTLLNARPIYTSSRTDDRTGFVEQLDALLGTPIVLLSNGPGAGDKQMHSPISKP